VPGLIAEGVNLLAGPSKVGKSWLSLGLALSVSAGNDALGSIPVQAGAVLYLALEDTPRRLQSRMGKLLDGQAGPRGLTLATTCPPLPEGGAAVKAKAAHQAGNRVRPTKLTVGGFFNEWMTSIKDSVKPSTFTNYGDYQDAYLKPTIWKKPLQKVDVPTLNTLYRHLLANGRCKPDNNTRMYEYWKSQQAAGRNLTPNELAAEVKGITIHAAQGSGPVPGRSHPGSQDTRARAQSRQERTPHDPPGSSRCGGVAVHRLQPSRARRIAPGSRKGTRKRGTTWTPDELAAWLAVAVNDRDAGIWVLAATTGMRRSELAGAERDLLDLDNATLEIAYTRVVVDGKADESDGKTESGRRVISLDPLTVA
jgi:integrase